jgi:hypothetical protein
MRTIFCASCPPPWPPPPPLSSQISTHISIFIYNDRMARIIPAMPFFHPRASTRCCSATRQILLSGRRHEPGQVQAWLFCQRSACEFRRLSGAGHPRVCNHVLRAFGGITPDPLPLPAGSVCKCSQDGLYASSEKTPQPWNALQPDLENARGDEGLHRDGHAEERHHRR